MNDSDTGSGYSATNILLRGLAAGLTFGVGVYLVIHQWDFSTPVTFAIGLFAVFMGLMLAGSPTKSWLATFGLIIFGAYQMAKALGVLENDYLRYIVGIPLVLIGVFGFIKMLNPPRKSPDSE